MIARYPSHFRPAAALVLLLFSLASAEYIYRPVSVSFVPPVSTNGIEGARVASHFSLNIIGGLIGRVDGFELGSCFNIIKGDASGSQLSGALNIVGGEFRGVQMAGAVNVVGGGYKETYVGSRTAQRRGRFAGAQLAPVNINAAEAKGLQAGAVNFAGNGLAGIQLGAANLAADAVTGQLGAANLAYGGAEVQVGAANVATGLVRVQIGAANITSGSTDLQVGALNFCRRARRVQIGAVNIADESDVSIGAVSIVRHGQFHVNAWASEAALVNLGIKTGSKYIYNVLGVGLKPAGDSSRLVGMYGLGGHIPLDRFFLDLDAVAGQVTDGSDLFSISDLSLLSQLRVTGGWQILPQLALTAGPVLSVFVSDREDGSRVPIYDAFIYHSQSGRTHVGIWPGFTVGLQLL